MDTRHAEAVFAALLAVAIAVPVVASVLGLFVRPSLSLLGGSALVATAAAALRDGVDRLPAIVLGLVGVLLGGGVVPVVATRAVPPGAVPEAVAGLVVVVFLAVLLGLHVTAFDDEPGVA